MSFVGPGSTITYTLMFIVKPPDGTYSAMFTIGTDGGNAINYPIEITVNSNDLQAAVTSKPTSFAPEAEQNVTLTLMNTRGGEINNVVITPEGEGIDAEPATGPGSLHRSQLFTGRGIRYHASPGLDPYV